MNMNVYIHSDHIRVRVVSDTQSLAFGSSLHIQYNTATHVVNSTRQSIKALGARGYSALIGIMGNARTRGGKGGRGQLGRRARRASGTTVAEVLRARLQSWPSHFYRLVSSRTPINPTSAEEPLAPRVIKTSLKAFFMSVSHHCKNVT